MGYYSDFVITLESNDYDTIVESQELLKITTNYMSFNKITTKYNSDFRYFVVLSLNDAKCYFYLEDLLLVSKNFPTLFIKVERVGEDSPDFVFVWIVNGLSKSSIGKIVYDDPPEFFTKAFYKAYADKEAEENLIVEKLKVKQKRAL